MREATTPFFDSHAHLDGYGAELGAVLERAQAAGVTHLVSIGASDGLGPNYQAVELARSQAHIFAVVGVHPHDARIVDEACLQEVSRLAAEPKVVAIGETGLDYHYDHSPREQQQSAFRAFLRLAREIAKPVVIHTREADEDTVAILRQERADQIGGVIHCFTGTERLARGALDLGFYLSFSGVITFRNADALRAIAKDAPRDRVLIETDSPYLAPIPHRGKRNEPAFVIHTAAKLAELWQTSEEEVRARTGANALRALRITL
ncbi:MAG: TatD family hydrolase [Deltaproteobacteria bacterium]|nr:TatD family hydrolase [Deltaproteobacteria bacterium]